MAGSLRNYNVHGSYHDKAEAVKKEREVHGFIVERDINGKKLYVVLTPKRLHQHLGNLIHRR